MKWMIESVLFFEESAIAKVLETTNQTVLFSLLKSI